MKKSILFLVTALVIVALGTTAMAATRYSVATGTWASTGTWSATSGGASGASAPVAGDNVYIEGGWTVTIGAAAACATLDIASGSALTVGAFTITVSSTTNITGTITFNSATGTKTFTGAVTLNSGAVWNETAAAAFTIANGITNNATTFTASTGVHTFATNAQAIGGSTTTVIPSVTVTTIVLTNNGTLTANTALAGTGQLSNSSSGTLNLGGTCSVTTLTNNGIVNRSGTGTTTSTTVTNNLTFNMSGTGTVTAFTNAATGVLNLSGTTVPTFTTLTVSASGNTVNYTATGTQAIKDVAYSNLGTSGSGTKTWTETAGRVMSGNLNVGDGTTLSVAGAFAWTVSGTTSIGTGTSGTLSITNATGTKTFTGAVTIGAGGAITETAAATLAFSSDVTIGGTLTLSGAAAVSFAGNFTNNGTFTPATSTVTFGTAGAQSIGGSGTIAFDNLTLSGGSGTKTFAAVVTASGTLSIGSGVVADLGTFTSSANMLTLGGTSQTSGSWGSSSSSATHQNDTYFAASTGIVNIAGMVDTWTGATSTDWNTGSNWDGAAVPASSDDAVINSGGNQPSVDATANCNNLTVNTGATVTNNSTLTVAAALSGAGTLVNSATGVLNLGGAVTITTLTSTAAGNTVNYTGGAQTVKTGTYVNLGLSGTGAKTTATVTVNGILTYGGPAAVTISAVPTYGAASTLKYSKTAAITAGVEWPTTFSNTGGVIISGTGTITMNAGGPFTVYSLTVDAGATLAYNRAITVSNATSISGTVNWASSSGTARAEAFTGDVTLNSGAVWTEPASGNGSTNTYGFAGNFTNDATTFNALGTGVHTFSGTTKIISGSTTTSIPSVTVSGTVENDGTLSVTTALAGAGTLSVGSAGTLNVNFTGAMGLTNLATTAGSIVKYGYAGTQTLKAITYDHLTLASSGAKTVTGATIDATGTLDIQGTATTTGTSPTYTAGATLKYSGSSAQTTTTVELPATTGVNVNINNSNGVNLGGTTTLNGTLTFTSGNLSLGANTLTLGGSVSGAAAGKCIVTDGAGGVASSIAASGSFKYEVAPSGTTYNPATIALGGADPTETFTVSVAPAVSPAAPNNQTAVQCTWTITEGTPGGNNATITFQWAGSEEGTSFNRSPAPSVWEYTGGNWIEASSGSLAGADPYTVTSLSALTSFSPFIVGNQGALPIQLASITANAVANNVNLEWTTVSETNTLGFYVERGTGKTGPFTAVSSLIPGAGTSTAQHNYSYADNSVSSGTYYYRLHEVDKNGKGSYSTVITVTVAGVLGVREEEGVPTVFKLQQNYPNPFNPTTDIKFWIKDAAFTTLKVYNSLGQEIASMVNGMMQPGRYIATWSANAAPSGVYFYRLQSGSNVSVQRMMLLK